jgi:hypothetical protein
MTCPTPPASVTQSPVSSALTGATATINVGPGQPHTELTTVPFMTLAAGTVINLFYRPTPYRTIVALRKSGITINGVTDSSGNRPVISGKNAVYPTDAIASGFYNSAFNQGYGPIFIYNGYGAANIPADIRIQHVVVEGSNQSDNYYAPQNNALTPYLHGAAGVFAISTKRLIVEYCEIRDNQNGIFVNSKNNDINEASEGGEFRYNWFHHNGNVGSATEHSMYIETTRPVVEFNRFDTLKVGAYGSSYKDRCSGSIFRYNRVEMSQRCVDFVESTGGGPLIRSDAQYNNSWTYGNLFIRKAGVGQGVFFAHHGEDQGTNQSRLGPHYVYNNTYVFEHDPGYKQFIVYDIDPGVTVVEQNNIYLQVGGPPDAFYWNRGQYAGGTLNLGTHRYLANGSAPVAGTYGQATTVNDGVTTQIANGAALDAANDYRPLTGSTTIDVSGALAPGMLPVNMQYLNFARGDSRAAIGSSDLGAFEFCSASTLTINSANNASGQHGVAGSHQATATGGTPPYTWALTGAPVGVTINPSTGLVSWTAGVP